MRTAQLKARLAARFGPRFAIAPFPHKILLLHPIFSLLRLRLERAIEIGRGGPAVDQEIGPGDESALLAHQQLGHVGDLIRGAGPPGRAFGKHVFVEIAARAVELVNRQRGDDDARRDRMQG